MFLFKYQSFSNPNLTNLIIFIKTFDIVYLQAKRRNQMAGLGAPGAKVVADVGDTYRDALRKTMFSRYSEVE